MDICIHYQSDGKRFAWPWNVDGGTVGVAIAVVERIKFALQLGDERIKRDPFEAYETERKICIHYDPEDETIAVNVRNLSLMQALEGLCEAQYTMQEQWFDKALAIERSN